MRIDGEVEAGQHQLRVVSDITSRQRQLSRAALPAVGSKPLGRRRRRPPPAKRQTITDTTGSFASTPRVGVDAPRLADGEDGEASEEQRERNRQESGGDLLGHSDSPPKP